MDKMQWQFQGKRFLFTKTDASVCLWMPGSGVVQNLDVELAAGSSCWPWGVCCSPSFSLLNSKIGATDE